MVSREHKATGKHIVRNALLTLTIISSSSAFTNVIINNNAAFLKRPMKITLMMAANGELRPKPPSTPPPSYIVPDDDGDEKSEISNVVANVAEDIVGPLLAPPIEPDVPGSTIKGAALSATTLALVSGASITAATSAGLAAAYVTIHPGVSGKTLRVIGDIAWSASQAAIKVYEEYNMGQNIGKLSKIAFASTLDALNVGEGNFKEKLLAEELRARDASIDEVVMEAEQVNRMVEAILKEKEQELDEMEKKDAKIKSTKKEKSKGEEIMSEEDWEASVKLAQKIADDEAAAEAAKIEAEEAKKKAEAAKAAAEEAAAQAEAERIAAEEAEAARIAAEEAEAERIAAEEAEAERIAAEEAEAERIAAEEAEAERIAAEEAEAARVAAEEAKALAEAARIAAEEAEAERIAVVDEMEDIGAAARRAVELFNQQNEEELSTDESVETHEEPASSLSQPDWAKMTVVMLKDELRSRGLKLSGKKADLIARLEEYSEQ